MPTRVRSIHGYFAAAAFIQRMRSGKPASPRFFQQTSWNAFDRQLRPHAVDLHDDEAELGQRLRPVERRERLGHERALRPGVDLLDHRILLRRVEVRRPVDHAVDVGLAVAPLGDEPLGRLPAGRPQGRRVGLLQLADQRAVLGAAQLGDRRQVHARVGVDQEPAVGRVLDLRACRRPRSGRPGRCRRSSRGSSGRNTGPARDGCRRRGTRSAASPRRRGPRRGRPTRPVVIWFLTAPVCASYQVEVVPAVALRHPDDLVRLVEVRGGTSCCE